MVPETGSPPPGATPPSPFTREVRRKGSLSRFFTSLGRFTVRFRFLVVVAWIVGHDPCRPAPAVPGDVAKDTTSGFLPANSPSMQAAAMAAPFQDASLAAATLVVARDGGLTPADNAAMDALEAQIKAIAEGEDRRRPRGLSRRLRRARRSSRPRSSRSAAVPRRRALVDAIRATFGSAATPAVPAGLQVHLTGQLATQVDTIAASGIVPEPHLSSCRSSSSSSCWSSRSARSWRPILTLLPAGLRADPVGPGHRRIHEDRRPGLVDHPAPADRAHPGRRDGLRRVPRVPGARGAPTRADAARRGHPIGEPGGRVDHVLGVDRHRRAAEPRARRVRLLPEPRAGARDRHRPDAPGRPDAAAGAARDLRAGGLLADGRKAPAPHEHRGLWDRVGIVATRRPGVTLVAGVVLFVVLGADAADDRGGRLRRRLVEPDGHRFGSRFGTHRGPLPVVQRRAAARSCMQFPKSVWDDPSVLAPAAGRPRRAARIQRARRSAQPQRRPDHDRAAGRSSTRPSDRPVSCRRCRPRPRSRSSSTTRTGPPASSSAPTATPSSSRSNSPTATRRRRPSSTSVPAMRADVERVAKAAGASASRRLRPGRVRRTTSATSPGRTWAGSSRSSRS